MAVIFDKLAYVRRLEQDGNFNRPQAEALSEALHDAVRESVATKQDLTDFRAEVSARMDALQRELQQQGKDLRQEVNQLRQEAQQQGKDLRAHTDLQISQLKNWILGSLFTGVLAVGGIVIGTVYGLLLPALRARGVVP